ncbi:hypothetical protein [Mesorhizobium sp. INR15]|uniref:hypothetical protein n=1 Tax=Mesorhizobium sp. INR15 TaxID=2654248 RepID=UPI0018966E1D|nr:hypothetical protein [Mesorhizobium sp. INR15]QPC94492.1 hypothetical protein GA829_30015 [Mesorhizobium sp. INR15]
MNILGDAACGRDARHSPSGMMVVAPHGAGQSVPVWSRAAIGEYAIALIILFIPIILLQKIAFIDISCCIDITARRRWR